MCACVYVCMHVFLNACVCICVPVRAHVCMRMHIVCARVFIHVCACVGACIVSESTDMYMCAHTEHSAPRCPVEPRPAPTLRSGKGGPGARAPTARPVVRPWRPAWWAPARPRPAAVWGALSTTLPGSRLLLCDVVCGKRENEGAGTVGPRDLVPTERSGRGTPHLTPRTSSTCRRPVPRATPVPATRWDFLSDSRQRPLSPPSDTQPQPPRHRVHEYTEGSARATAVFTVAVRISRPFNGVTGCCHVHQVLIEVSATLTPQRCGFMCDLAQGTDLYELPGCITAKASVCLESFVPGEMTGQIRIRGGHLIPQEDGERLQERDRAGSDGGRGPPAEECPQGAHVLVPGTSEPHLARQRNLAAVTKLRTQTRASTLPHLDGPWTYSGGGGVVAVR